MFKLPLFGSIGKRDSAGVPHRPPQPFSALTLDKHARVRGATVTHSVCPYCAVGCGTNIHTKGGDVIDIEGNPDSPINEGTLCPKGANIFQLHTNPHRLKHVLWRAPYSDHWERKPLDWAMDRIARRVKETRDETFVQNLPDGTVVSHTLALASLGGATLDNEENYLIKQLFGAGLGMVWIGNQARI